MKKYVKPELFYESFELSQQIAACDFMTNNTADDTPGSNCWFTQDLGAGFVATIFQLNENCTTKVEGYCYYGSTGNMYTVFNS